MSASTLPRAARSRATAWVALGATVGGVAAYVFQIVGTRALGDVAYAPIGVLWTLQYLILAIPLVAVEAYVARGVTLKSPTLGRDSRVLAGWLLVGAGVLGAACWLLREPLFAGLGDLAFVVTLTVATYGALFLLRGQLAGAGRYRGYGAATAGESLVRLALAVGVLAAVPSTRALAWIMPLGPVAVVAGWLVLRGRPRADLGATPAGARAPAVDAPGVGAPSADAASAGRYLAATTTANAVAQTLLAAGPLVVVALGAAPAEVAVFFVTITAARTPLTLMLGGGLTRVLPPLTRMAQRGDPRGLRRVALATALGAVVVAVAGAAAAAVVGSRLVALLFGVDFAPDTLFVTVAGFGMAVAVGALVVNQVLIAARAEARLVVPWLVALAVAAAVVAVVDGSATLRVVTGFAVGEVVALAGLTLAALRVAGLAAAGAPGALRRPARPVR